MQYLASVDDPRIAEVRILRPQEIPQYVAEGLFDLGITGRDWIEETASDVVSLGELRYSKATARPIRLVVAVAADTPYQSAADLPQGVRVSTEYLGLTRRFFEKVQGGRDFASALAETKREFAEGAVRKEWRAPAHWAAFVLYGG